MASLVCVYNLRSSVDVERIARRMEEAGLHLRPQRHALFTDDQAAVAGSVERVPSGTSRPPIARAANRYNVVFNGRIDNRRALEEALGLRSAAPLTDAGLVCEAFCRWDSACAERILGDFVFLVYDAHRRRLFCARDQVGVRTLYYAIVNGTLVVASQLRQVVSCGLVTPELELEYVADYLPSGMTLSARLTPYKGVFRLPPGHYLFAADHDVRVGPYWDFDPSRKSFSARAEEHIEHFGELFQEAVRCRLEADGPIWSDLSGGLDSSSIVATAHSVLGERARDFQTVTVAFNEALISDERQWSTQVVDMYGYPARYIDGDLHYPFRDLVQGAPYWDEPHPQIAFFSIHREYARLLNDAGAAGLLTGIGAETVVMGKTQEPIFLAQLLKQLRWRRLWRELDVWQRALAVPLSNVFLDFVWRPILEPQRVEFGTIRYEVPSWVKRSFASHWNLRQRLLVGRRPRRFKVAADQWQYEKFGRITTFFMRGYLESASTVLYPFLDRRLMEFSLALPWDVKLPSGHSKALLRQAMVGRLPEDVRTRTANTSTGHSLYQGIRKEWPYIEALVRGSVLAEQGIIDRTELYRVTQQARVGYATDLHVLLSTLTLEAWLQTAFSVTRRSDPIAHVELIAPALSSVAADEHRQ